MFYEWAEMGEPKAEWTKFKSMMEKLSESNSKGWVGSSMDKDVVKAILCMNPARRTEHPYTYTPVHKTPPSPPLGALQAFYTLRVGCSRRKTSLDSF